MQRPSTSDTDGVPGIIPAVSTGDSMMTLCWLFNAMRGELLHPISNITGNNAIKNRMFFPY